MQCLSKAAKTYPKQLIALSPDLFLVNGLTFHASSKDMRRDIFPCVRLSSTTSLSREVHEQEHQLFALPAKSGGLALEDPVEMAPSAYAISKEATAILHKLICSGDPIRTTDHTNHCQWVTWQASQSQEEQKAALSQQLLADLPKPEHRTLSQIV